jgi:hypothetical protein
MAASAWHFICLARASKDHSERYKVRVSAAEAPAPEDCAVVIQETSRDFGTSTSDVEQLGLATVPSIKVESGNDSWLSLEFRPEKTVRSQVVTQRAVATRKIETVANSTAKFGSSGECALEHPQTGSGVTTKGVQRPSKLTPDRTSLRARCDLAR